jgi:hypothetical protein
MQALLARHRGQGLPRAPAPPEEEHINLQHATTHMPEATPEQITENLKAWYDLMAGAEPDMGATVTAQMYAMINTELRTNGNEHGTGPQFLLCNTGIVPREPSVNPYGTVQYAVVSRVRN